MIDASQLQINVIHSKNNLQEYILTAEESRKLPNPDFSHFLILTLATFFFLFFSFFSFAQANLKSKIRYRRKHMIRGY